MRPINCFALVSREIGNTLRFFCSNVDCHLVCFNHSFVSSELLPCLEGVDDVDSTVEVVFAACLAAMANFHLGAGVGVWEEETLVGLLNVVTVELEEFNKLDELELEELVELMLREMTTANGFSDKGVRGPLLFCIGDRGAGTTDQALIRLSSQV